MGLNGRQDGRGSGLTRSSMIAHLCDHNCRADAQVVTRHSLTTDLAIFSEAELTFHRIGIWLCGVCFKMHYLHSECCHGQGSDFVAAPDVGDGVVRFVLYGLSKPQPNFEVPSHVDNAVQEQDYSLTVTLIDRLLSKQLRTAKSISPKYHLGFSRVLKGALDKVICKPVDISCWVNLLVLPLCILKTFSPMSNRECSYAIERQQQKESIANAIRSWSEPGGIMLLLRETLAAGSPHLIDADLDLDLEEHNIKQCCRKICDGHYIATIQVLSSSGIAPYNETTLADLYFPCGTSRGRDDLRAQYLMDCLSGAAVVILDDLVDSISGVVNLFLAEKCPMVLGEYIASAPLTPLVKPGGGIHPIDVGGEAILHAVKWLIEDREFIMEKTPYGLLEGCSMVLQLIMEEGPRSRLHVNVEKIEIFWPIEDTPSRIVGVFSLILLDLYMVLGCLVVPAVPIPFFSSELVMERVTKTIMLMDKVAKLEDPQSFDGALRSSLERIITASGLGFGVWQWRLATLPFAFGGLGVYSADDVRYYAFLAYRLQYTSLQTKLLQHAIIIGVGRAFEDALSLFNRIVESDILSDPIEVADPTLMKKLADIYFTNVTASPHFLYLIDNWHFENYSREITPMLGFRRSPYQGWDR
ncbi:hypothetical protein OROHE_010182 [Orobanche hederae]